MQSAIRNIATGKVLPNPEQHRRHFDEAALGELADSIRRRGILQNLVVRKHPSRRGFFEVIAGERRLRAAKRARLPRLPCRVIAASDAEAFRLSLVENVQRVDVSLLEEADGYGVLRDKYGMTPEAIAEAVGKPPQLVYQRLVLTRLSRRVRSLIAQGLLSEQAGYCIGRLEDKEEQTRVALVAVTRELRDREVNRAVNVLLREAPAGPVQNTLVAVAALSEAEQEGRSRFRRALDKAAEVLREAWDTALQETNKKVLRSAVERDLEEVRLLRQWLGRVETDLGTELARRNLAEATQGGKGRKGSGRQSRRTKRQPRGTKRALTTRSASWNN